MWSASNKEHIHKSSIGRADMAHWPNHGPDMDRECLAHAIPGCTLLSEWSKIKQNPDTCVRFDMPSCGRTKRRRVEIDEDTYADFLSPSSPPPAEDAAADTGAHGAGAVAELANNEGAQSPLRRAPLTEAAAPGAPAAPVPAAAGTAAEVAAKPALGGGANAPIALLAPAGAPPTVAAAPAAPTAMVPATAGAAAEVAAEPALGGGANAPIALLAPVSGAEEAESCVKGD